MCGDEWYYYQFFLAGNEERRVMRRVWGAKLGWVETLLKGKGEGEGGNGLDRDGEDGEGVGCPLVRVVTVEGLLRGLFGMRWEVPKGSIR